MNEYPFPIPRKIHPGDHPSCKIARLNQGLGLLAAPLTDPDAPAPVGRPACNGPHLRRRRGRYFTMVTGAELGTFARGEVPKRNGILVDQRFIATGPNSTRPISRRY